MVKEIDGYGAAPARVDANLVHRHVRLGGTAAKIRDGAQPPI
jgi:hypothetical protein